MPFQNQFNRKVRWYHEAVRAMSGARVSLSEALAEEENGEKSATKLGNEALSGAGEGN